MLVGFTVTEPRYPKLGGKISTRWVVDVRVSDLPEAVLSHCDLPEEVLENLGFSVFVNFLLCCRWSLGDEVRGGLRCWSNSKVFTSFQRVDDAQVTYQFQTISMFESSICSQMLAIHMMQGAATYVFNKIF
jgi:hypothetical protein